MGRRRDKASVSRQARALLWLLPVLGVASWLVWEISRVRPSGGDIDVSANATAGDYRAVVDYGPGGNRAAGDFGPDGNRAAGGDREAAEADEKPEKSLSGPGGRNGFETEAARAAQASSPQLFPFDPNTIRYHDLVRLGFTRGEALGIVKYRERGKIFEIPEDFAACYQVSEEMYLRLHPWIRIGEEFRLKPFDRTGHRAGGAATGTTAKTGGNEHPGSGDTAHDISGSDNADSGSAGRGGNAGAGNSNAGTGNRDTDAGNIGSNAGGTPAHRTPARPAVPIELNSADSAALISVAGIGEKTLPGIMDYRARLGGFVRAEQLAEVRGVTEQNYERIVTQIFVDSLAIQKIDINFAGAKQLASHPYIRPEALRKLLKYRQLKGGWSTAGELREENIFTPEEFARLRPYLLFGEPTGPE